MFETHDVLARFHGALLEEILARRPEYLHAPFTVAEIYQNLVPYGTHRDRIGVEMNGDYEDALLRLLSGEGGYLVLDSEPALRALRKEVERSNPNTGIYREFAAVDVRLAPERLPAQTRSQAPRRRPETEVSVDDLAPDEPSTPSAPPAASAAAFAPPASGAAASGAEAGAADAPESCRWCRAELPRRENLNFCPFCGTDVHVVPCPGCGEELDPEWRFCIACGTEVGG